METNKPTAADMRAFGASHTACYLWPNDTDEHRALRAAYISGAADCGEDKVTVQEMLHTPTIERCARELETGLNVHRWINLWTKEGKLIPEPVAIAFYYQALQDGWEALRALTQGKS